MPEHFHLLVSEPAVGSPPLAMQVLKQRMSRRSRRKKKTPGQLRFWKGEEQEQPPAFWQKRYYDFNVYTERKYIEKLRYMHRNPVKRGLVTAPELWRWSSFRHYWFGEKAPVKVG
jgi:putative transposase